MVENNWLGDKTGQVFSKKKGADGEKKFNLLNLQTWNMNQGRNQNSAHWKLPSPLMISKHG